MACICVKSVENARKVLPTMSRGSQTKYLHAERVSCPPHSKLALVSLIKVVHKWDLQGAIIAIFEIRGCCRDMMHALLSSQFLPLKCKSHDVNLLHLGKSRMSFLPSTLLYTSYALNESCSGLNYLGSYYWDF